MSPLRTPFEGDPDRRRPVLVVLSGLPGVGKTTLATTLAAKHLAAYVRIDAIETALRRQRQGGEVGAEGYAAAYAVAVSNLRLGAWVIADSVNPVPESRQAWREVASSVEGAALLEVEVICSDVDEHRRRVESRTPDLNQQTLPTWSAVICRPYIAWQEPRLIIDTAHYDVPEAILMLETALEAALAV